MEPANAPERSTPPRILVGTDFSPTAEAALDWAVELARPLEARIELVHAVTVPPSLPPLPSGGVILPGPAFEEEVRQAARVRLDREAAQLRAKGVEAESWLGAGTPSLVLNDRAAEVGAEAVVIGTRGLTGLRHLLLGSTTQRVVQGAPCPVLTIHPEDFGRHRAIRTILVPTDFSEDAAAAIHTARRLLAPAAREAKLILLHAFNLPIEYTAYGPIPTSVHYLRDTGLDAERRLEELSRSLEAEGLPVDWAIREGDPSVVISEEAESRGADLIAMATHGHTGLRHLLLGSTAERVVQLAKCPVMTIRVT